MAKQTAARKKVSPNKLPDSIQEVIEEHALMELGEEPGSLGYVWEVELLCRNGWRKFLVSTNVTITEVT